MVQVLSGFRNSDVEDLTLIKMIPRNISTILLLVFQSSLTSQTRMANLIGDVKNQIKDGQVLLSLEEAESAGIVNLVGQGHSLRFCGFNGLQLLVVGMTKCMPITLEHM